MIKLYFRDEFETNDSGDTLDGEIVVLDILPFPSHQVIFYVKNGNSAVNPENGLMKQWLDGRIKW